MKSPPPLTNSLVPSSGSTRKNSSPTVGKVAGGAGLLGDHRYLRRDRREVLEDHRLGGAVGHGDGRVVGFRLDGDILAGARIEDRPPGFDGGGDEAVDEVGGKGRVHGACL